MHMGENSTLWLALREASRRILVEQNLVIRLPKPQHEQWHRLILNMGDSMPQRLEFPLIEAGDCSFHINEREIFSFDSEEPNSLYTLWLPFNSQQLIEDLLQMCSELLLAGYPGCSGCGYRDDEEKWDEASHRQRLKALR